MRSIFLPVVFGLLSIMFSAHAMHNGICQSDEPLTEGGGSHPPHPPSTETAVLPASPRTTVASEDAIARDNDSVSASEDSRALTVLRGALALRNTGGDESDSASDADDELPPASQFAVKNETTYPIHGLHVYLRCYEASGSRVICGDNCALEIMWFDKVLSPQKSSLQDISFSAYRCMQQFFSHHPGGYIKIWPWGSFTPSLFPSMKTNDFQGLPLGDILVLRSAAELAGLPLRSLPLRPLREKFVFDLERIHPQSCRDPLQGKDGGEGGEGFSCPPSSALAVRNDTDKFIPYVQLQISAHASNNTEVYGLTVAKRDFSPGEQRDFCGIDVLRDVEKFFDAHPKGYVRMWPWGKLEPSSHLFMTGKEGWVPLGDIFILRSPEEFLGLRGALLPLRRAEEKALLPLRRVEERAL